jgi:hypothetical protein
MFKKTMAILILTGLLAMGLSTVPASAAAQGSSADELLIYDVSCTPVGGFSARGFARRVSNHTGSLIVTIDFVGVCSDGQTLALTCACPADLSPLANPNGKPNGNANGYDWSVNDAIVTIPELGPVSWSAVHVKVTLTNKWGTTTKESDLPLPSSPF